MQALADPQISTTLRNKLISCYTIEACPFQLIYQEEEWPGQFDEFEYIGVKIHVNLLLYKL